MRILPQQRDAIVRTTTERAGPGSRVHLFGSRLHDPLRGSDIDLRVQCPQPVARPVWLAAQITARLQRALGERKIDVLLIDPATGAAARAPRGAGRGRGVDVATPGGLIH